MKFDWQSGAVLMVVIAAGAYLARSAWRSIARRKATGCGSCGSCPVASQAEKQPVIGIEQLRQSATGAARTMTAGIPKRS